MSRFIEHIKKSSISIVLVPFLVLFYPVTAIAAAATNTSTAPQTTNSSAAPTSAQTDPQSPPGPDANTYHYNPDTGNWENDHYIWNPTTQQTTPKDSAPYSYDPTTQQWSTSQWQYDAASGQYQAVPTTVPNSSVSNSTTSTGLNNTIGAVAQSGDATVSSNTQGGDASTGNAADVANIINLLQSSFSTSGNNGTVATFVANIPGNVTGDLLIDPSTLMQNQPTSAPLQSGAAVAVNNQNSGSIDNQIVLNATSGNAAVLNNTAAGNATSGNAGAIANIINLMNSSVNACQSFVGMVNIQGDLSGNILLPQGFLDSLIASNAGANSTTSTAATSNVNSQNIQNTVTASAGTGDASVAGNTMAGNATTGTANTRLTVMNLTGSNIIGNNALMVFVNVLGTWTGLIVNAPQGATVATLGGNIDPASTTNSTVVPSSADSTAITNTNTGSITNNVTVQAHSGDATVEHNTDAGNATSGNASAVVNLANIISSHLSLSHWFGVLFINVLGSWEGNFGSAVMKAATNSDNSPSSTTAGQVFSFNAHQSASSQTASNGSQSSLTGNQDNVTALARTATQVLGASSAPVSQKATANTPFQQPITHMSLIVPAAGIVLGILVLGSDKLVSLVRRS